MYRKSFIQRIIKKGTLLRKNTKVLLYFSFVPAAKKKKQSKSMLFCIILQSSGQWLQHVQTSNLRAYACRLFIHSNFISCSLIGSLVNTRSALKMSTALHVLRPDCARCFWCVIVRVIVTSTDPFFSPGKVVNILYV